MASGFYNGSVLTDSGAAADSYVQNQQNGTVRSTMGFQNSSSSWKLSMGAFGTNDTVIADATGGKYKGYGSNTVPAAGFIGEEIRSYIPVGSAIALPNGVTTDVTFIDLTPGAWSASAIIAFGGNPSAGNGVVGSIVFVSGSNGTAGDNAVATPTFPTATQIITLFIPALVLRVAVTTRLYMTANVSYASGSAVGFGRLSAIRIS
jgi:hypothetical protein